MVSADIIAGDRELGWVRRKEEKKTHEFCQADASNEPRGWEPVMPEPLLIAYSGHAIGLLPAFANRHGL
ncbi:MAG TPA: hypothetical protein VF780_05050, partial [Nitrosospira sp.]